MQPRIRRWRTFAAVITLMAATLLPLAASASTNDMIAGGCHSRAECGQKIASSGLLSVYASHGFSAASFGQSAVRGTVTKSGQVMLADGTVVATGAQSYGRTFLNGSTKVGPVYRRPTSVAFQSSPLTAYIVRQNGQFQYAVLTSCGNLVTAMPKIMPAKPAPVATPAPTPAPATTVNVVQVQSQTQSQTQPAPATPTPAAAPAPKPTPQPTPQPALPQTGATTAGVGGLSVLATVAWYYRRSRLGLQLALRGRPAA